MFWCNENVGRYYNVRRRQEMILSLMKNGLNGLDSKRLDYYQDDVNEITTFTSDAMYM